MRSGRFREDLYYRLCADLIKTPTLAEQFADCPEDLSNLIRFIVRRVTDQEVEDLAGEAEEYVRGHPRLGRRYAWPGNFRELEQCVWNVLIRNEYEPARPRTMNEDPRRALAEDVAAGALTADELERRYYTLVLAQSATYQDAARFLGRNWRTVKSKIDPALLEEFKR